MFKPANLRRVFFGLLGLGAMRSIMNLVSFYLLSDSSVFSISVLQLIRNLLLNFSPAALTYILYWFSRRKYGEDPEEKPKKTEKPERIALRLFSAYSVFSGGTERPPAPAGCTGPVSKSFCSGGVRRDFPRMFSS